MTSSTSWPSLQIVDSIISCHSIRSQIVKPRSKKPMNSFEQGALDRHNYYRALHGVPPLEWCQKVCPSIVALILIKWHQHQENSRHLRTREGFWSTKVGFGTNNTWCIVEYRSTETEKRDHLNVVLFLCKHRLQCSLQAQKHAAYLAKTGLFAHSKAKGYGESLRQSKAFNGEEITGNSYQRFSLNLTPDLCFLRSSFLSIQRLIGSLVRLY